MEATIPTRGLIGFEFELPNLTSGEGIMSHLFKEYRPDSGDIRTRRTGTLVSMEKGESMTYALRNIETRGKLFVGPGEEVYEGMIVGENPRTMTCRSIRPKPSTSPIIALPAVTKARL